MLTMKVNYFQWEFGLTYSDSIVMNDKKVSVDVTGTVGTDGDGYIVPDISTITVKVDGETVESDDLYDIIYDTMSEAFGFISFNDRTLDGTFEDFLEDASLKDDFIDEINKIISKPAEKDGESE